jgi:predicted ATPase
MDVDAHAHGGQDRVADRLGTTNPAVHLTPLIGRRTEIDRVRSLLHDDATRLITLTGPGGVGKTRLAHQALASGDGTRSGDVVFVGLAPIADPALVPGAVAQALNVREAGDLPIADLVRDRLRSWSGLLFLDNFEQVIHAAPFVSSLLRGCPHLKVLVTSRTVLRVTGEREFAVPPLPLPTPSSSIDETAGSEAVGLFPERARAVRPGFALTPENTESVVEICRRLDGLPLAIELAASRAKILSPAALLARLDHRLQFLTGGQRDQPERHQTIRAATSWSYDLLSVQDQSLFRRLSIFAGGFSLEAAEAVCGPQTTDDSRRSTGARSAVDCRLSSVDSVLDGIASLVDKSLVRQTDGPDGDIRFGLLETIREFGLERLVAAGEEAALRQLHADSYLAVAEEAGSSFTATVQESRLARLQIEHPNFRQALAHHAASGEPAKLLRMAGALAWFWHTHAHITEGMTWLEEALRHDDRSNPSARAKALLALALMVRFRGESDRALVLAEESLELYRPVGDEERLLEASTGVAFRACCKTVVTVRGGGGLAASRQDRLVLTLPRRRPPTAPATPAPGGRRRTARGCARPRGAPPRTRRSRPPRPGRSAAGARRP